MKAACGVCVNSTSVPVISLAVFLSCSEWRGNNMCRLGSCCQWRASRKESGSSRCSADKHNPQFSESRFCKNHTQHVCMETVGEGHVVFEVFWSYVSLEIGHEAFAICKNWCLLQTVNLCDVNDVCRGTQTKQNPCIGSPTVLDLTREKSVSVRSGVGWRGGGGEREGAFLRPCLSLKIQLVTTWEGYCNNFLSQTSFEQGREKSNIL